MGELKVGQDYHLAEVASVASMRGKRIPKWQAYCEACGWAGPVRGTMRAADEDALAHDVTENAA